MKLSDIPDHVTDLNPPWFHQEFSKKYNIRIDEDMDVIPAYHLNYYDGPLSGIIKVADRYFYTASIYGEERKWWAVWELTEEELTNEQERHKLFQQYVGTHTDYYKDKDENWTRDVGTCKPRESCDIYYKMENKPCVDYAQVHSREIFGILRNPFWNW